MHALAALIRQRQDAEPGLSLSEIARRSEGPDGSVSHAMVAQWAKPDRLLRSVPADDKLRALSRGLGVRLDVVRDAARRSTKDYTMTEVTVGDRAWTLAMELDTYTPDDLELVEAIMATVRRRRLAAVPPKPARKRATRKPKA